MKILRSALVTGLVLSDAERFDIFLTDNSGRKDFPFVLPAAQADPAAARVDAHSAVASMQAATPLPLKALDNLSHSDPTSNPLMPRLRFGSNGWVVAGLPGHPLSRQASVLVLQPAKD